MARWAVGVTTSAVGLSTPYSLLMNFSATNWRAVTASASCFPRRILSPWQRGVGRQRTCGRRRTLPLFARYLWTDQAAVQRSQACVHESTTEPTADVVAPTARRAACCCLIIDGVCAVLPIYTARRRQNGSCRRREMAIRSVTRLLRTAWRAGRYA